MAENKTAKAKKQAFAREYIRDYNATAAAIRAGYSARTAGKKGPELKNDKIVQAEIARLEAARSERYGITEERLIHEISKRALVNIYDVIDEDGNIRPDVDRDSMSTVTKIKTRRYPDGSKETEIVTTDSAKYLDLLAKVAGYGNTGSNKAVHIEPDGSMRAGVIFIPAATENASEDVSEAQNDEE